VERRVNRCPVADHLDCNWMAVLPMECLIDYSHATGTEFLDDFVLANDLHIFRLSPAIADSLPLAQSDFFELLRLELSNRL